MCITILFNTILHTCYAKKNLHIFCSKRKYHMNWHIERHTLKHNVRRCRNKQIVVNKIAIIIKILLIINSSFNGNAGILLYLCLRFRYIYLYFINRIYWFMAYFHEKKFLFHQIFIKVGSWLNFSSVNTEPQIIHWEWLRCVRSR